MRCQATWFPRLTNVPSVSQDARPALANKLNRRSVYPLGALSGGLNMTVALVARIVLLLAAVAGSSAQARAADSPTDQELVARELPAVVSISILRAPSPATGTTVASAAGSAEHSAAPRGRRFLGSGFIIDPSGIIVTNRHVIEG